ncbi:MAG: peptidoglycan-associated lipoprotein Pal [Gemmatimonadota bacterium]|nr:peptidoglycan-associated lipoprotein Pal [Gemmatimonadota bacterium]
MAADRPPASDAERAAREARDRAERDRLDRERLAAERLRVMTASVYFEFDRSDLTAEARSTLDAKLGILSSSPELRIRIAGHADERGSDEYNMALGQRRAAAAKRYLVHRGIDANRVDVMSFGEERPICTESHEGCWSRNRRGEFEIVAAGAVGRMPESF